MTEGGDRATARAQDGSVDGDAESPVPETPATEVERPEATVPSPEVPSVESSGSEAASLGDRYWEVDPAFRVQFWKLVVLYKLGILGLSLGVLFVVFDTYQSVGRPLALGALVLLGYAVVLTRRTQARIEADEYDLDVTDEDDAGRVNHADGAEEHG